MQYIDTYLRFEKLSKAKTRFDLTSQSRDYPPLSQKGKKGDTFIYLDAPLDSVLRKLPLSQQPTFALTKGNNKYVSGLYFLDPAHPQIGFGDVKGKDALLVKLTDNNIIEIFVLIGKKNNVKKLFSMLCQGALNTEIAQLRATAKLLDH